MSEFLTGEQKKKKKKKKKGPKLNLEPFALQRKPIIK